MKCKKCDGELEFLRIGRYVEGFRHKEGDVDHYPILDKKEVKEWLRDAHYIVEVKA